MDTISHGLWAFVLLHRHSTVIKFVAGSIFVDSPFLLAGLGLIIQQGAIPDKLPLLVLEAGFLSVVGYALHSIAIWGIMLAVVYIYSKQWIFFVLGWGFHIAVDIFTHVNDALPLFWPLSKATSRSFVSYWEPDYHSIAFNIFQIGSLAIIFTCLYYFRNLNNKRR